MNLGEEHTLVLNLNGGYEGKEAQAIPERPARTKGPVCCRMNVRLLSMLEGGAGGAEWSSGAV